MNPAPAELLQLLTIAALQPTTLGHAPTAFSCASTSLPLRARKEKAALPEEDQAVRLILFVTLYVHTDGISVPRIRSVRFVAEHAKTSMFTF
jgi:hypothetical protein